VTGDADRFLTKHNDACITNYWANWDLCTMAAILAIGILCDDQAKIDQAVNYVQTGAGNGSILHAIPFQYPDGLAQWQESGRDQGHTMLGIGLLGDFCEMAWNQGYDLYGYGGNRFLQACEYVVKYNLGQDVPFTTYTWGSGQNCAPQAQTVISSASRGQDRPVWERVYNHYVLRRGLVAPYTEQYAARVRPEGGGGDYGTDSGGYDHLGFGTLAATRPAEPQLAAGICTLTNQLSGKNLDNGSVTTEGGQVIQWTPNTGNAQLWRITQPGGGYYQLVSGMSGKALDNGNFSTEGATAIQWTANGGRQQRWRLVRVG
jgi:Ricin-type beta-trefoil lectin domain-like/Alginate lyase